MSLIGLIRMGLIHVGQSIRAEGLCLDKNLWADLPCYSSMICGSMSAKKPKTETGMPFKHTHTYTYTVSVLQGCVCSLKVTPCAPNRPNRKQTLVDNQGTTSYPNMELYGDWLWNRDTLVVTQEAAGQHSQALWLVSMLHICLFPGPEVTIYGDKDGAGLKQFVETGKLELKVFLKVFIQFNAAKRLFSQYVSNRVRFNLWWQSASYLSSYPYCFWDICISFSSLPPH